MIKFTQICQVQFIYLEIFVLGMDILIKLVFGEVQMFGVRQNKVEAWEKPYSEYMFFSTYGNFSQIFNLVLYIQYFRHNF